MPKVFTVQDEGDALSKLFRKVGELERMVTRPDVMGATLPPGSIIDVGGINIGPPGGQVLLDLTQPPVTGVITTTPGAYMDDIFIDLSWTALADTPMYEVEMTKVTAPGVYSGIWTQQTGANNIRFRGLEPNMTYGFRVYAINHLGIRSTPLPSSGWTQQATGEDTTIPPAVTSVLVVRGASTVLVKFTGLTEAQAADVANGQGTYHIQISTDNTFASVTQEQWTTATIISFGGIHVEGTYYARVRAIDKSGNASAWANGSSGATAGGLVESMIVGDFSAAKITYGTMDGDRITANTASIQILETGTLTARNITLGAAGQILINDPPNNGIVLNANGIRAYKATALTFVLDYDGTATFSGTVSGATINGGTINGTTLNGITLNVGLPPAEGITMNAFGLTAYAKPNYVFKADRDPEGSIGNWEAWYNSTLAASTTYTDNGISSLRARATAAGNMGFYLIDWAGGTLGMFGASAGQTWTVRIRSRAGSVARSMTLEVRYYDVAGSLLQVTAGAATVNSTSGFVEITAASDVAPATTAKVGLFVQVTGCAANENHYFGAARITKSSDASFKPILIDSSGSIRLFGADVIAESYRTQEDTTGGGTYVDDGSGYIVLEKKIFLYGSQPSAYVIPAEISARGSWSSGGHGVLYLEAPYEHSSSVGSPDISHIAIRSGGPLGTSSITLDAATLNLTTSVVNVGGSLEMGSNRIYGTNFGWDAPAISTRGGANNVYWDWSYSGGIGNYYCFVDNSEVMNWQYDPAGVPKVALFWQGEWIDFKSFVIPHPTDEERLLVHACLEGDTADVHYRGGGVAGTEEVEVTLPPYFEALTLKEHRTLEVFPVASANGFTDSKAGLEWTAIKNGKFRVRAAKAGVAFGYLAIAERKHTKFNSEPLKTEVDVFGDGPYTYLRPKGVESSRKPILRQNPNKKGSLVHG